MNYPEYIAFEKGHSVLKLTNPETGYYYRSGGEWGCYVNGELKVARCPGGPHLKGRQLYLATEQEYLKDNEGYV